MTTLRRLSALAALACALAGCAQSAGTHTDPVLQKEQNAVAPLKDKYKDVITGIAVKDRTLTLYVEPNAMYSMDEDAEAAMKSGALERWKKAWSAAHPRQHGTVRLVVRDYFGRELSAFSATV
jgi:PBP1b-binding outer membrane lipoprotein LpoB